MICSENYRNKSYEHGYREIFAGYCKLYEDFCANKEKFTDLSQEQSVREEFQHQCEVKCKNIQIRFLNDIQACTNADMKRSMDDYLKKLEEDFSAIVKAAFESGEGNELWNFKAFATYNDVAELVYEAVFDD